VFFTAVWGADWKAEYDRAVPGASKLAEQAAATMFESELPAAQAWHFGADEAATIQQPVLYLLGSESLPLFAEGRDLLHTWLPQTEGAELPGANHLLQIRDPAGVAATLADFLGRHPISER
jgi:pimeloyl-ACP methyl ester carboxylesterase